MKRTHPASSSPLFSGLDEADFDLVMHIAKAKKYTRGETFFMEGDPADGFHLVLSGRAKVYKISSSGKEQILKIAGPGETFGEAAVFSGTSFPAFASALEDTEILFFRKDAFLSLLSSTPRIAFNMLATMSELLRKLNRLVEELSLKDVASRVARYLLEQARLQGSAKSPAEKFSLPVSKQQIALNLGIAPETLSRMLARFTQEGFINLSRRTVQVLEFNRLDDVASGEAR